jgi:hypothetical protein
MILDWPNKTIDGVHVGIMPEPLVIERGTGKPIVDIVTLDTTALVLTQAVRIDGVLQGDRRTGQWKVRTLKDFVVLWRTDK